MVDVWEVDVVGDSVAVLADAWVPLRLELVVAVVEVAADGDEEQAAANNTIAVTIAATHHRRI
ncbi:MAG: hypothetical protein ACR2N7_01540 [Acidimicrobiia bacterium]